MSVDVRFWGGRVAKKSTSIDVTQGVIWQQLLSLCVPIFFSSFFQQAYTLIGTYIVGQFGGKLALGGIHAAAVILPKDFKNELLNDSKQLTEKQRYALREVIEKEAIAWAVGIVSPEEIDEINILRASFLAMHRAVDQLSTHPQHLLIDGNRFTKYPGVPHTTVVKGDGKYLSIAAASILAKTYRDDYMNRLHEEFPYYDWDHNKGYPTKKHRAAIAERGTTPYHRMTFNLLRDGQLTLSF